MWERACSRRRQISHPLQRLTHRFRGQARSHSFDRCSGLGFGVLRHLSGRYSSVPTLKYTPNVGAGLNWSSNLGHRLRFHATSFSLATGDR
ncbi:hypothetical protein C9382_05650 [Pseudomonas aylmerensis]|uniref:Uncharacterized protein n=1 Tax=Pseudomonas aylmerensis TaxID=1869229 RepID=A0A2T4G799_9PSED|nr:hypothetical protein C9382_05650 [Pseudomonas aylmerensis]